MSLEKGKETFNNFIYCHHFNSSNILYTQEKYPLKQFTLVRRDSSTLITGLRKASIEENLQSLYKDISKTA